MSKKKKKKAKKSKKNFSKVDTVMISLALIQILISIAALFK